MSEREQVMQIIDQLPDYKLGQILLFLRGVQFDNELEDDRFCEQLYLRYLENSDPNKHDTISLEKLAAREGISL